MRRRRLVFIGLVVLTGALAMALGVGTVFANWFGDSRNWNPGGGRTERERTLTVTTSIEEPSTGVEAIVRPNEPPAVVDVASLEPGAIYDRPFMARAAVNVDPAAALRITFASPFPATAVPIFTLHGPTGRVELGSAIWRSPTEAVVRPQRELWPRSLYHLEIATQATPEHQAAAGWAMTPLGDFHFKTRAVSSRLMAVGDVDGNGHADLITAGPAEPLVLRRTFQRRPDSAETLAGPGVLALCVGDWLGDLRPDIAYLRQALAGGLELVVLVLDGETWRSTTVALPSVFGRLIAAPPVGLFCADVDADGWNDWVVIDPFGDHRWVLNRRGTGVAIVPFPQPSNVSPAMVTAACVADLDGDSMPDLLLADIAGTLSYAGRTGTGGFAVRRLPHNFGLVSALTCGDFNRDGRVDVALLNAGRVEVWLNTRTPDFEPRLGLATPTGIESTLARAVAAEDWNADGHVDLAWDASAHHALSVAVALHDRANGLKPPVMLAVDGGAVAGHSPHAAAPNAVFVRLAAADFDADGTNDLVAMTENGEVWIVLTSDNLLRASAKVRGAMKFRCIDERLPASANRVRSVAAGDVNRDGRTDLVAGVGHDKAEIWLGLADGRFAVGGEIEDVRGEQVVLLDVDRDGDLDVLLVDLKPSAAPGELRANGTEPLIRVAYNGGVRADWLEAQKAGLELPRGEFSRPVPYFAEPLAEAVRAAVVADLNLDGEPDVLLASTRRLLLFMGRPGGGWVPMPLPELDPVAGLLVGDWDGDGKPDVVLHTLSSESKPARNLWLRNLGAGRFEALELTIGKAFPLATGDFDANRLPDLVWHDSATNRLELSLNRGNHFEHRVAKGTARFDSVLGFSISDFDGDGTSDVVIWGRRDGSGVQDIWRSDGFGTLHADSAASSALRDAAGGRELRPVLAAPLFGGDSVEFLALDSDGTLHLFSATRH